MVIYLVCDPLTDLSETFGGPSIPKSVYLALDGPSSSFKLHLRTRRGKKYFSRIYVVQHDLEPGKSG